MLLDEHRARGNGTTANRVLAALSRFFAWCVERDVIEASPAHGIRKPAPEVKRERVLSDTELALIWKAAEIEGYPFGDLVRLLMLTAQRRDEVAGASWPEIDLVTFTWSLPGARTKNSRPHGVPLSESAVEILEVLPKFSGGQYLFGLSGRSSFSGYSHAKTRLDERIQKVAKERKRREKDQLGADGTVSHWTLHDLRRTAATRMAELGVMPHIVEAVLNHISGSKAGVAGTYNRALYEAEKRAALELWGKHIIAIVKTDAEQSKAGQEAA